MVTEKELEVLLKEPESDLIERKRSLSDGQSIRQTICAFANDLPNRGQPGILLVGVEDNGDCAGLAVTDELLNDLSQISSDGSISRSRRRSLRENGWMNVMWWLCLSTPRSRPRCV